MANDHHGPKGQEPDEAAAGLKLSDALKKLITAGIGAAFMTEESIRNYVSELKLPKEELMHKVGNEIIKVVNRIDFVKEASRFVEEHKFKIKAEVEVVKKDLKSGHSVSDKDS
jgi:hypothetical protein